MTKELTKGTRIEVVDYNLAPGVNGSLGVVVGWGGGNYTEVRLDDRPHTCLLLPDEFKEVAL